MKFSTERLIPVTDFQCAHQLDDLKYIHTLLYLKGRYWRNSNIFVGTQIFPDPVTHLEKLIKLTVVKATPNQTYPQIRRPHKRQPMRTEIQASCQSTFKSLCVWIYCTSNIATRLMLILLLHVMRGSLYLFMCVWHVSPTLKRSCFMMKGVFMGECWYLYLSNDQRWPLPCFSFPRFVQFNKMNAPQPLQKSS